MPPAEWLQVKCHPPPGPGTVLAPYTGVGSGGRWAGTRSQAPNPSFSGACGEGWRPLSSPGGVIQDHEGGHMKRHSFWMVPALALAMAAPAVAKDNEKEKNQN